MQNSTDNSNRTTFDFLADSGMAYSTIRNLRSGRFGGFAAAIGDAASVADNQNFARLMKAFPELFWAASEL
jgi:hypothetical protein